MNGMQKKTRLRYCLSDSFLSVTVCRKKNNFENSSVKLSLIIISLCLLNKVPEKVFRIRLFKTK